VKTDQERDAKHVNEHKYTVGKYRLIGLVRSILQHSLTTIVKAEIVSMVH